MSALKLLTTLAIIASALVAGCMSTPTPAPILLTLPPAVAAATVPAAPAAAAPLLGVRRVVIPEYMQARRVRYRADPSTLAEWPNTFWAERIEIGVSREFVSALRQQLPGWQLCDAGCADQQPALSLQVELVPMDYVRSTRRLQARARLVLSSPANPPKELKTQDLSFEVSASADTAQAQAEAITELLRQAAQAAALLVRELPR
ncbi:MAG: ABC-type transport auxiliary lipoprotein family protein [Burkholderiales bacterium]